MWKYRNVFLCQKFSNWKRSVSWCVIVVQHPIIWNVSSDSLDPFSKLFQDIFVEGMINCLSWRYKFFVDNVTDVEKNNNHSFHPGSAQACFLRMRTFRVPFLTLPFGLGIVVEHPWFISCYYFIQKIWLNFESSQQILTISNRFSFCSTDKFLDTSFARIFRMCKWSVRILFLLQSSWHSIGGLSPSQLAPLPYFDHMLTRLVFQNKGHLQNFLVPLWKLRVT